MLSHGNNNGRKTSTGFEIARLRTIVLLACLICPHGCSDTHSTSPSALGDTVDSSGDIVDQTPSDVDTADLDAANSDRAPATDVTVDTDEEIQNSEVDRSARDFGDSGSPADLDADGGVCEVWPPTPPESVDFIDLPCPPCTRDSECPFPIEGLRGFPSIDLYGCYIQPDAEVGHCLQDCHDGECPEGQICYSAGPLTGCGYECRASEPRCPEGFAAFAPHPSFCACLPGEDPPLCAVPVGPIEDRDDDGIPNADDLCPDRWAPKQWDTDGDGHGDLCDPCPDYPNVDPDSGELQPITCDDPDGDQIPTWTDMCPELVTSAAGNEDLDGDGDGDGCDEDVDGDAVPNDDDNCPRVPNVDQEDTVGGDEGDACEDNDGDGVLEVVDVCPEVDDPEQKDLDGDGLGDRCDDDPDGDDSIFDDLCPIAVGSDDDGDDDGVPDLCDVCPDVSDSDQSDLDADGVGDACEDTACPTANAATVDTSARACEVTESACPPENGPWSDGLDQCNDDDPVGNWRVDDGHLITNNRGWSFGGCGWFAGFVSVDLTIIDNQVSWTSPGPDFSVHFAGTFVDGCTRFEGTISATDGDCSSVKTWNMWASKVDLGAPALIVPETVVAEVGTRTDVIIDVVDPDCRNTSVGLSPRLPNTRVTSVGGGRHILGLWPEPGSECTYHVDVTGRDCHGGTDTKSIVVEILPPTEPLEDCEAAADCSGCDDCHDGHCLPVRGCTQDLDCPREMSCAYGRCRHSCDGVSCPPGYECGDGVCRAIGCSLHNCPDGMLCSGGVCVHEHPDDVGGLGAICGSPYLGDCRSGTSCTLAPEGRPFGMCTFSCTASWQCGAGAACSDGLPEGSFCVRPCLSQSDCREVFQDCVVPTDLPQVCLEQWMP